jgi:NAD(P)-dependent dehydrogenase (short-subunit alcohol dehydrogenase family)
MTQRAAMVTGGVKRIGAFIAKHLAKNGYHVFIVANRSTLDGANLVGEIANIGGSAELICADIGKLDDVNQLMQIVEKHSAPLSVLVNNASYFEYDAPFEVNFEILRKSIEVHILGPMILFENLKTIAKEDNNITIVNMLDQKLENMNPDYYSYTIGKIGLYGLTKIWQSMQNPYIRTFGILLGLTLVSGQQTAENFLVSSRSNPSGRPPNLEEITALIDFFIDNTMLTGQTIALDGGAHLTRRYRDVAFNSTVHASTN